MDVLQRLIAYFTNHPCFATKKKKNISPVGILVHSTGSVNRELRRYVDSPERLGENQYNNHWNKLTATKSVHAFIGYDKNKNVIVAETLPHDVACWGCGGGAKGSYNYDPHAYIQFEICEGSETDEAYYKKAIECAEEYCAYLCRLYGWSAEQITSHKEAHKAGYASNHGDPHSYMKNFGDDMNKFRARVAMRLNGTETPTETPTTKDEQIPVENVGGAQMGENGGNTATETSREVYTMKTLKVGSKGTQVKVLQWLLNHTTDHTCGTVDGIFGTKTLAAVRQYQEAKKLAVDGIVGKNTWAALLK